jgi:hypothetical protein
MIVSIVTWIWSIVRWLWALLRGYGALLDGRGHWKHDDDDDGNTEMLEEICPQCHQLHDRGWARSLVRSVCYEAATSFTTCCPVFGARRLVCCSGGPVSIPGQSVLELWCTKCHRDSIFRSSAFPCQYHCTGTLHPLNSFATDAAWSRYCWQCR